MCLLLGGVHCYFDFDQIKAALKSMAQGFSMLLEECISALCTYEGPKCGCTLLITHIGMYSNTQTSLTMKNYINKCIIVCMNMKPLHPPMNSPARGAISML